MGINLSNKVSEEDRQAVRNKESGSGTLDDSAIEDFFNSGDSKMFDGLDELDSDDNGWDSIGSSTGSSSGSTGTWVGENGWTNLNNSNNQNNQQTQEKTKTDELVDKAIDYTVDTTKTFGSLIKELKDSMKSRTLDDYGFIGSEEVKIGAVLTAVGLVLTFILYITKMSHFTFMTGVNVLVCGMLTFSFGIIELFTAAYLLSKGISIGDTIETADDLSGGAADIDSSDSDDIWGDLFDDDEEFDEYKEDSFDSMWDKEDAEDSDRNDKTTDMMSMFDSEEDSKEDIDYDKMLDNIHENTVLNRKYLVDTFKPILPLSSPKFHTKTEIMPGEDQFITIEAICLKALSNLCNCDVSEVDSRAESIYETDFSYEIYLQRVKKINNLPAIEREMEAYFRSDSEDFAVTAKVTVEGDFYKIIISKGDTHIVTIGDVLGYDEYYNKIIDEKCKLPLIYGINELGDINIGDGKICDSTLIAGKQRSGKSWYLLGMLMCLMMFNDPETVQFILIDPKDTALFKVLSWMPHVAGIHTAKGILDVLDDVINNEGAYRKKLLKDNMCDTIWELREKGVKLPILYVCIDEYISAMDSLGDRAKELNERLLVIKTQFPSQGIRVIFIPHRATGVVDKTNRATTSLKVAVRTELEDTRDTLGEQKWTRPLVNPGDMAMRAPGMMRAEFMRGVTLGRSDEENRTLIETIAKAYYKMGVDLPDMSRMPIACNRNSEQIRAELTGESIREQYNANSIFSMLEED